eukprot:3764364-Rhodomonas_salina.1
MAMQYPGHAAPVPTTRRLRYLPMPPLYPRPVLTPRITAPESAVLSARYLRYLPRRVLCDARY